MPTTLTLGPLALPIAPLALLMAVWLAQWVASRRAQPDDRKAAGDAIFGAALAGLLAARIAHLLAHAEAYLETPWAMLDLRDGGWNATAGLVLGALTLLRRTQRHPPLGKALRWGAASGLGFWLLAQGALLQGALKQGEPLPTLAVAGMDDGSAARSLAELAGGRPAVVNLWASWCGPCRSEMPTFAAAQRRHPDIAFIFVNQGESAGTVHGWLTARGLQLDNVRLDPGSALGRAVGSTVLPTTLFIDAQGRRVSTHVGALNAAALRTRMDAIRAPARGGGASSPAPAPAAAR